MTTQPRSWRQSSRKSRTGPDCPPRFHRRSRTYLRRCLHKDPRERVADAQDIRLALHGAFDDASPTPDAVRTVLTWRRVAVLGGAVLLGAAAAGAGLQWFIPRQAPPRVSRFEAAPAPAAAPAVNGSMRDVAITADGSRIVYVSSDNTHLFVRTLDALQPVTVFTGTPNGPFVSPDGRWIGFVDGTSVLKKVPVAGGAAITLATLDGALLRRDVGTRRLDHCRDQQPCHRPAAGERGRRSAHRSHATGRNNQRARSSLA